MAAEAELVLFYGPPYCGKTAHFFRRYAGGRHERLSLGDESRHQLQKNVLFHLGRGRSVVVDDCNRSATLRTELFRRARERFPQVRLVLVQFVPEGGWAQCEWGHEWALAEPELENVEAGLAFDRELREWRALGGPPSMPADIPDIRLESVEGSRLPLHSRLPLCNMGLIVDLSVLLRPVSWEEANPHAVKAIARWSQGPTPPGKRRIVIAVYNENQMLVRQECDGGILAAPPVEAQVAQQRQALLKVFADFELPCPLNYVCVDYKSSKPTDRFYSAPGPAMIAWCQRRYHLSLADTVVVTAGDRQADLADTGVGTVIMGDFVHAVTTSSAGTIDGALAGVCHKAPLPAFLVHAEPFEFRAKTAAEEREWEQSDALVLGRRSGTVGAPSASATAPPFGRSHLEAFCGPNQTHLIERARGEGYDDPRKLTIVTCSADPFTVQALSRGSMCYKLELCLEEPLSAATKATCTCPYSSHCCKHLVGLLLYILDRGFQLPISGGGPEEEDAWLELQSRGSLALGTAPVDKGAPTEATPMATAPSFDRPELEAFCGSSRVHLIDRARGEGYDDPRKVTIVSCSEYPFTVRATSQGTSLYNLDLELDWKLRGGTRTSCSCPAFSRGVCKHVVGVLLYIFDRDFELPISDEVEEKPKDADGSLFLPLAANGDGGDNGSGGARQLPWMIKELDVPDAKAKGTKKRQRRTDVVSFEQIKKNNRIGDAAKVTKLPRTFAQLEMDDDDDGDDDDDDGDDVVVVDEAGDDNDDDATMSDPRRPTPRKRGKRRRESLFDEADPPRVYAEHLLEAAQRILDAHKIDADLEPPPHLRRADEDAATEPDPDLENAKPQPDPALHRERLRLGELMDGPVAGQAAQETPVRYKSSRALSASQQAKRVLTLDDLDAMLEDDD